MIPWPRSHRERSVFTPNDQALIDTLRRVLTPIGYRITSAVAAVPTGSSFRKTARAVRRTAGRGRDTVTSLIAEGPHGITNLEIKRAVPASLWLGVAALGLVAGVLWARRRSPRRIGDIMISDVETIDPAASVADAARRMREANVGVLPVVEGGRLRGVVTDRDIVIRAVAQGVESSARVRDCLTSEVVFVRADWSPHRAMALMAEHQIGRLPVVDDDERLIGIVTLASLARRSRHDQETLATARQVAERAARAS